MNDTYLKIALGIGYVAAGLFATLSGFGVIHPFRNHPERIGNIEKYKTVYRYGGLLIIAYGVYKLVQQV